MNRHSYLNICWLFVERSLRIIVSIIVLGAVAKYFGVKLFGVYSFALGIMGLCSMVIQASVDELLVRDFVRSRISNTAIITSGIFIKLCISLACILITIAVLFYLHYPLELLILTILMMVGLVFQVLFVFDLYFQSKVLYKYVAFSQLGALTIGACLKFWGVFNQNSLFYFGWVYGVENLVLALSLLLFYNGFSNEKKFRIVFDFSHIKSLWQSLRFLLCTILCIAVYQRFDYFVILKQVGNAGLGTYAAALSFCDVWSFIPISILNTFYPVLLKNSFNNKELFQQLFDYMVIIALLIIFFMFFGGAFIIKQVFGQEYMATVPMLVPLAVSLLFSFLGIASQKWLICKDLSWYMLFRVLVGLLVNVSMNLMLIPRFGLTGAIITVVVTQFIAAFAVDIIFPQTRECFWMKFKSLTLISPVRTIYAYIYRKSL